MKSLILISRLTAIEQTEIDGALAGLCGCVCRQALFINIFRKASLINHHEFALGFRWERHGMWGLCDSYCNHHHNAVGFSVPFTLDTSVCLAFGRKRKAFFFHPSSFHREEKSKQFFWMNKFYDVDDIRNEIFSTLSFATPERKTFFFFLPFSVSFVSWGIKLLVQLHIHHRTAPKKRADVWMEGMRCLPYHFHRRLCDSPRKVAMRKVIYFQTIPSSKPSSASSQPSFNINFIHIPTRVETFLSVWNIVWVNILLLFELAIWQTEPAQSGDPFSSRLFSSERVHNNG